MCSLLNIKLHCTQINYTKVVIRVQDEGQKNRPGVTAAPGYCMAICFYCMTLGHMFLLCGARPYVSIGWLWAWGWAICFYYAALGHMFVLVGCGPYVYIVRVYVCVCVTICFHRRAPSQGRNLLAL